MGTFALSPAPQEVALNRTGRSPVDSSSSSLQGEEFVEGLAFCQSAPDVTAQLGMRGRDVASKSAELPRGFIVCAL